jgi:hypothetical protein
MAYGMEKDSLHAWLIPASFPLWRFPSVVHNSSQFYQYWISYSNRSTTVLRRDFLFLISTLLIHDTCQ